MDPVIGKGLLERFYELLGQPDPVPFGRLQLVGDRAVLLRLGETEVDVLHLALDVVEPKLVCQRNVQHQGLQNLFLPGSLRKHLQMPHYLQPVRDLEHGHTRVCRVLYYEFLVAFGLQPGVLRLDGRDLVQSINHFIDVLRESAFRFRSLVFRFRPLSLPKGRTIQRPFRAQINLRMLSGRLVEEHRRHAVRRQTDLVRRDQRHVDRMLDEGVSVATRLVGQRRRSYSVRFVDESLSALIVLGKSLMNRVHSKSVLRPRASFLSKIQNFFK